jgi:hypothetical protein
MKTAFDEILPELCKHQELAASYSITFLGKGWDFAVTQLRNVGYDSQRLGFVDVYLDEIIKYDIQLTPISVGTGTKGKVLGCACQWIDGDRDSLCNGEHCCGKWQVVYHLRKAGTIDIRTYMIFLIIYQYEEIAEAGREAVLKFHDRATVSEQLFQLFRSN